MVQKFFNRYGCLLLVVACVLGVFAPSGTAFAAKIRCEDLNFTIVNNSGKTIDKIYLSPSHYSDWAPEDGMTHYPLHHGEYLDVDFPDRCNYYVQPYYDLRVEYRDGSYDEWTELDLYKINKMGIESVGEASFLTAR